ncbi:ABC transporter ATP-binding protein [Guptibacillus hwajinpoensis]|uniref:ABC transporter ATP-binding protein n=1 Tax=Guptibacillus hwajinpoensis TaxID=208199 RepID=A0A0J6CKJ9_9BACL|nr:ATP-binding cassette domain-containing protein [Alkalihalobacillus macyae]KMM36766.1 ABC transporter ATP-binding protein [Alkalihalobacillus macyae]
MENVIEVRNLTKKIKRKTLINDASISIKEGVICGFLGPNGAGKTTLMRLLTGLVKPNKGEVLLNGKNVNKDREEALRHIGAIVEAPVFFEYLSGRKMLNNLARLHQLSKSERKQKVEEVLEIVNLKERGDDIIKTYSLGMKQRLGIAQALLGNPKVIILDEPANGLDPIGMRDLRELILYLNSTKNITFFISSHLLDELQHVCNELVMIKDGEIKYQGSAKDVLKDDHQRLEDIFFELMSS